MTSVNPETCKVCGKQHLYAGCLDIINLSNAIHLENGEREERLRNKCQWEHMTRYAVLSAYGDPANW
jgi:hypothetical protein